MRIIVLSLASVLALLVVFSAGLEAKEKPNIVTILLDDMAYSDLKEMPKTKKLLVNQGTTFRRSYVTLGVCCPSRATILRGQYPHNHKVYTSVPPYGGAKRFKDLGRDKSTVATWLQDSGYTTAHIGKYLNKYNENYIPPGWDYWNTYYNAFHIEKTMNNNGQVHDYPDSAVLDQIAANKANHYIRNIDGPMYLQVGTHSPHAPYDYPKKYKDLYKNAKAPRYASTNEDIRDKPEWVPNRKMDLKTVDKDYRERMRTLRVVDDLVGTTVKALRESGKLDNTYIVFTSDNGWHYGEHRVMGKWTPYEEALRVPTVVRGPGVPEGKVRSEFVLNNDLAPTFADLAGVRAPDFVDGTSIAPLLRGEKPAWRHSFLYESFRVETDPIPAPAPTHQGVRTRHYNYTEYETGEHEIYNHHKDPRQLTNIWPANYNVRSELHKRLYRLKDCAGAECRRAEGF